MSVMLPKDADLLGVPLLKVRNLLQAWHRSGPRKDIRQFGRKRGIELPPSTTAVLTEELRDRGFIGAGTGVFGVPVEDGLTSKGKALASAVATVRTSKEKARKVFDGVLDAADVINARDDLPFRVAQIWLFGSMVDPRKSDVGDIDFCVELERRPGYEDRDVEMRRYWALAEEMAAPYSADPYDWVRDRLLFGARRHPLLSRNYVHRLITLGCPCRLAFDGSRGGRVDDPVSTRHPQSIGRDPMSPEPHRMPDLTPAGAGFGPVHVDLLVPEYPGRRDFRESHPLWTSTRGALEAFDDHFGRLPALVTTPHHEPEHGRLSGIDFSGCDGRSSFAMLLEEPAVDVQTYERRPPGCCLVIGRSIDREEEGFVYRLRIEQHAARGGDPTHEMLLMARWVLNTCMKADIERIARRSQETGIRPNLRVELDAKRPDITTTILLMDLRDDLDPILQTVLSRTGIELATEQPEMGWPHSIP